MGQFNDPKLITTVDEGMQQEQTKADLLFWHQKWRQRFQNVVLRGPFPKDVVNDLSNNHDLNIHFTKRDLAGDSGFISPSDNLLSTLIEYEHHSDINGVLYVHDDMLLNVTNIFDGIDRKKTILHSPHVHFVKIHPLGTVKEAALVYTAPDGVSTENKAEILGHMEGGHFNSLCLDQLSEVAKDPRSKAYLEKDEMIQDGKPFMSFSFGQADFVYVPTSVAKTFIEVASLFVDHKVLFECAIPSIIRIMATASKDIVDKSIDLSLTGTTKPLGGPLK